MRAALLVLGCATAFALGPAPARAGSFSTNDEGLNAIWAASVKTAEDMLAPGPITTDVLGRPCAIDEAEVILDGAARDRCPYIGDESVIDATFDAATPHLATQRAMLAWFAEHQHSDGAIPASPLVGGGLVLFDYNAYWIQTLHRYVLYSGDLGLARQIWPALERLVGWYAARTGADGLLRNDLGPYDYAFIRRAGPEVAYYNAQAVLALRDASALATWIGATAEAQAWAARAARTAGAFGAFWDPAAGAYSDTVTDRTTHPQDGNSFAVLARIPQTSQAVSALAYLNNHNQRDYGNTISDSASWDDPAWGSQGAERVYPFMSYYELLARFETGLDDSAFYLIRREWGYMLRVGPGTMWETIGPFGGRPTDRIPSFDAGWSSGAAPALTEYVLGIRPTSPGFATFTVTPHPGDLLWAKGSVSTPHGDLSVRWELVDGAPRVTVEAPAGETWENAPGLTPKAAGVRVELGHGYSYLHPASAASRVSCAAARPHGTRIVLTAARWRLAVCFSGKRLAREALHGRFGGVVGYLCVGDRRRVGSLAQCR